jgi:xylulokinase
MAELFVGFDIGTTQVKGGLFRADGAAVASWSRAYPTERPGFGVVEQDPRHWLDGVRDGIAALAAHADPADIAAVGLCSQVNTDVFTDRNGVPLAPAIVWQDVRAFDEAAALGASIGAADKAEWWGEGVDVPIGASHVLAKMAWFARHDPALWEQTAYVFSPKDYCIFHLTGVAVTDPMSAWGQVGPDHRYVAGLLARVAGAAERLPPVRPMTEIVGRMRVGGRTVPLVAGTMDAWGNLFGCGVFRPGQGMYMSGTSEILAMAGDRRVGAQGVVTFPELEGMVVHAGPTQSGGDSLRWWAGVANVEPLDVPRLAGQADRCGRPVLFLPHLEGERAPLWDADIRGAFIGLDSRASAPEFALAVLEGVSLSGRLLFEALTAAAGFRPGHLLYGGGGSRSDLWSQIRADCLGVPMHRLAHPDIGCLGAAIMGAVGVGRFARMADAVPAMTVVERVFEPDPAMQPRYDALFYAYRGAIEALRPIQLFGQPGSKGTA